MALIEERSLPLSPYLSGSADLQIASSADYEACRQIMHAASKNYSFAGLFLPASKKHHVEALYAFFRVGDDRVDVSHQGFASKAAAIDAWEESYWRAFEDGDSDEPVMRAYLQTALECGIPKHVMGAYFRAMREDLTITRFETFGDLLHYMDGSAIPVGRGMTYILGVRDEYTVEQALRGADSLSIAMQLSNFWRDIGEDWGIGRVYLPKEDMDRFGVSENDIAAGRISPEFVRLMEFEMARTEQYYALAREGVSTLRSGQAGVLSALEVYAGILTSIRQHQYDVFTRRNGLSLIQKIAVTINAWRRTS